MKTSWLERYRTTILQGKEDGAVQENGRKTLWNKQAFSLLNKEEEEDDKSILDLLHFLGSAMSLLKTIRARVRFELILKNYKSDL